MPIKKIIILAGITVFFFAVIGFLFFYGPAQRAYTVPSQVLSVESTANITQLLESNGYRGRVALCFTRYLNALESKESKEGKVIELAMHHGILRKVFHIPPDSSWPEISEALSKRNDMRPFPGGFIGIFDDGRVYITPLSRFSPISEKTLIIIEPKVWTHAELQLIAGKLKSGALSSDLLLIIRGSEKDAGLFRQAMTQ